MTETIWLVLAALLIALGTAAAPALAQENNRLPDGSTFYSWELPQRYTHTYHVAQQAPGASDDNPGSPGKPWKTIGQAAQTLQPGERVVIHAGVYREWVQPARGGDSPITMIAYEAAPGEEVTLKGSDEWAPQWAPTDNQERPAGAPATWRAELPPEVAAGKTAFTEENFPPRPDWGEENPVFLLRRGQVILGGEPLRQVGSYADLLTSENGFWVEGNEAVHVRLAGEVTPPAAGWEITTRPQVFAPAAKFLGFIRVSGLRILHAANGMPIPYPQRGALSAMLGHHWIIEDCEIADVNTIGADIGGQWWPEAENHMLGFHLVRRNWFRNCPLTALCAWHAMANQNLLIEDNLVTNCGWLMPGGAHAESSGIKLHRVTSSLIRRNVILHTRNSGGLWLDAENFNTRVTQNLICDTLDSSCGAIFIEINRGPNLVDNNIIVQASANGITASDAGKLLILQNLVFSGQGAAIWLNRGGPRIGDQGDYENQHVVRGNVLGGFDQYVQLPNPTSVSDYNVLGGMRGDAAPLFRLYSEMAPEKNGDYDLTAWRALGFEGNSVEIPLQVSFNEATMELSVTAPAGAQFPPGGSKGGVRLLGLAWVWELLQTDFLGRPRPGPDPTMQVGPLLEMPLDGTPVKVDPRQGSRFGLPPAT